jgi:hypothetical protein
MLIRAPKPSLPMYRHVYPYPPASGSLKNPAIGHTLSQTAPANRHHSDPIPGKQIPIASSFVAVFVAHGSGKSSMVPTRHLFIKSERIDTAALPANAGQATPACGRLRELAEGYQTTLAPPNLLACALATGKNAARSTTNLLA